MTAFSHPHSFITDMKTQLEAEQSRLQQELSALATVSDGEVLASFPDYGEHEEENAMEIADYQAKAAMVKAIEARLKEVAAALKRIEDDRYGVTADGRPIPEARLRANPAAQTLVE